MKYFNGSKSSNSYILGNGLSPGREKAVLDLICKLPAELKDFSIIVAYANDSNKKLPADIWALNNGFKILPAKHLLKIQKNHLYIAPSNCEITIVDNQIHLNKPISDTKKINRLDIFFSSLALNKKEKAIAVLLSGTENDGYLGMESIKESGGCIIAEKPKRNLINHFGNESILLEEIGSVLSIESIGEKIHHFINYPKNLEKTKSQETFPLQKSKIAILANNNAQKISELVNETLVATFEHPYVVIDKDSSIINKHGELNLYFTGGKDKIIGSHLLQNVKEELRHDLSAAINKAITGNIKCQTPLRKFKILDKSFFLKFHVKPIKSIEGNPELFLVAVDRHDIEEDEKNEIKLNGAPFQYRNENIDKDLRSVNNHYVFQNPSDQTRELFDITGKGKVDLHMILESISDGLVLLDAESNYIYANKKAASIFGFDHPDKLIHKNVTTLFPEEYNHQIFKCYTKVLDDKNPQTIIEFYEPTKRWLENRVYPTENGIAVFYRDITDQKLAENTISKTQELLEHTEAIAHIGSWEYNIISNKLFFSDEVFRICGYEPNSFVPDLEYWLSFFHPDDQEKAKNTFINSILTGQDYEIEKRLIHKNGSIRYMHSQAKIVKSNSGHSEKMIGTFHDVTDQKEAENNLVSKNNQLVALFEENKKILDASLDVICSFDNEGRFVQASAASKRIWGYSQEELIGQKYMDLVYEEDKEKTIIAAASIMAGNDNMNFENRYRHKNGGLVPILWSAKWDSKENLMFCIAKDASELKEAEKIIKLSEEKYRQLFLQSPLAMWVYDSASLKFLEVNEAAINTYGYPREEFLNLTIKDIQTGKFDHLNHNGSCQHLKKSGEAIYVEISSRPIDYNGIKAVFISANDVTIRFETEAELIQTTQRVQNILESITDGFFTVDQEWVITYFNNEAESILKVKKEIVLGQVLWNYFKPAKELKFYTEYHKALNKKIPVHFDEYYPPLNLWIEVSAYPFEGGLSIYFKDITEQKRKWQLEQLAKILYEKNAQPESTLEEIINIYLYSIVKMHDGKFCSLYLKQNNKFVNYFSQGFSEAFKEGLSEVEFIEFDKPEHKTFLQNKMIVPDIRKATVWENYLDILLNEGLLALCTIPIKGLKNEVLGIFVAYYKTAKSPSKEEENTFDAAGNLLTVIITNKFAEQALRQSNERFDYATSATNDAIYDYDIEKGTISWGKGYFKLFGYQDSRNYNIRSWESRIHSEDILRIKQSLEKGLEDTSLHLWNGEYRYLKADNSYAFVVESGNIIRDENKKAVRMVGAIQDITQRKKVEKELHNLSLIAKETVNAVIVTNPIGEITWVNDGFYKISGYTIEEVSGKKPSILQGQETDPETIAYMRSKIKDKEPFDCEIINYTKTGRKYWISIKGQPIFDPQGNIESFFAIETDVTKQKEEQLQLQLLESVITNANDAVIISVPDKDKLNIVYVNHSFNEITGYDNNEVLGKSPFFLHGKNTNAAAIEIVNEAIENSQPCEVEYIIYKKNGEEYWAHLSLIPISNVEGEISHWISIQRDVTLRRKAEEEREAMIKELTQNNTDLTQFSYIISHNIRAPLSNLLAIVNLLEPSSISDSDSRLLVEKFKESTVHLNSIINDLVGILVIKNNTEVIKEEIKLAEIFSAVKNSEEYKSSVEDAIISTDFKAGDMVNFNPGYMHTIFSNLMSNAIKFRSPKRELEISVKTKKENNKLELHFTDNGVGFDMDRYKDRVFVLYQRFHDQPGSKGMGLFITKTLVKAMGGEITADSKVDGGTTFIIKFQL